MSHFSRPWHQFLLPAVASLMLPSAYSVAQTPNPEATPSKQEESTPAKDGKDAAQKVIVTGSRGSDMDQRRQASAAKLIFGREELDRNGDNNIGEVLKRLPGVSIGGRAGRGGEIRMRGMGAGYTQILINGERAPRGFNLESLSPEQVERIEVIRGTVAENSTQAIAGTINIILREGYQQKDNQLKISDTLHNGKHLPSLSATVPGKLGNMTYTLSANLGQNEQSTTSLASKYELDQAGAVLAQEDSYSQVEARSTHINFSPRLAWKFDNGDTLTLQSFLMQNQNKDHGNAYLSAPQGNRVPLYNSAAWKIDSTFTMGRLFGNWIKKLDGGGRLDIKFGGNSFYFESSTPRQEYDASKQLLRDLYDEISTRERGANLSAKYSISVGDGHLLAAGWEGEWSRRTQTRLALINQQADPFNDAGDDNLQANSRRLALFVQDEWDINKQWSVNLGLRWEGIKVKSGQITNSSSVFSPIAHAVWRVPGMERDQVRMSATHSYRAPQLGNLIATPTLSRNNSASSPDRYGNPQLQPEKALGLEIGYEHYLAEGGIVSANVFHRQIKQLMRRTTFLQNGPLGPRWTSMPINIGNASTHGIELEAKFRLSQMIADAPAIDLRANYSWMWSSVDGVQGPNNRLDNQAKHTLNLGADYRPANSPLTIGTSFNWTPSYLVQSSPEQVLANGVKRQIDVYALYKISNTAQLRLAANNLLARDAVSGNSFFDANRGITHLENGLGPTDTVWSLRLELKL